MTVQELIDCLSAYPNKNENVYVWKSNWPYEHYTTNLVVDKPYGAIGDDNGKEIDDPLIIHAKGYNND